MADLNEVIKALRAQNKNTALSRFNYLSKEAERKHYEATLTLGASADSHNAKVTLAQSSKEWLEFHRELAKLESRYQFELMKLKILELEFQAQYLSIKQDGKDIGREGADDERRGDYRSI